MPGLGEGGGLSGAIEAGKAFVKLGADDKGVKTALDRVKAKFSSFGAVIAGVGLGMAGLGGAILTPMVASLGGAVERFDAMAKAADRLGTTPEIISTLGYAAKQSGSDVSELEGALGKLQKNMSEAANGGPVAESFDRLGLSAKDLMALPLDEQLAKVADALEGVDNPAERTALGMDLLGKSARQLFPLLKGGSAGLAELRKEAELVGEVVSEERARQAEKVGDSWERTQKAFKNAFLEIGASFLPEADSIEQLSFQIAEVVRSVRLFIQQNAGVIRVVALVAAGLVVAGTVIAGLGAAIMAVSGIITAATTIISAIGAVIAFIASPVGIAVVAILALIAVAGVLVYIFRDELMMALNKVVLWIGATFKESIEAFKQMWEGVGAAIKAGNLELAFKIVWAGIKVIFFDTLNVLRNMTAGFLKWMIDSLVSIPQMIGDAFGKIPGFEDTSKWLKENIGDPSKMMIAAADASVGAVLVSELNKAKEELKQLVDQAKREAAATDKPAKAPNVNPYMAKALAPVVGQRGSFSAAMSMQRFAQGDSFEKKQEKAMNKIADNTKRGADEVADLNKNMRVK